MHAHIVGFVILLEKIERLTNTFFISFHMYNLIQLLIYQIHKIQSTYLSITSANYR
jgi:hypothetical protein